MYMLTTVNDVFSIIYLKSTTNMNPRQLVLCRWKLTYVTKNSQNFTTIIDLQEKLINARRVA
jgi:hypothetical protein